MRKNPILLLLCLLGTIYGFSQPVNISDLYPVIKKIPEDGLRGIVVSSGCVTGNCDEGRGRFIVVSRCQAPWGSNNKSSLSGCKLYYHVYDGQFRAADSSFEGTCSMLVLEMTKKEKETSYRVSNSTPDWNQLTVVARGQFVKAAYQEYGKPPVPVYFKHGKVTVLNPSYEFRTNGQSPYSHIEGFFQQNDLAFGSVVYQAQQPNSRFTGLFQYGQTGYFFGKGEAVNEPLYGTMIRKDGSVFTGFQPYQLMGYSSASTSKAKENNREHEAFIKVMADTALLAVLTRQPEKNVSLIIQSAKGIPPPNFMRMRKQETQYRTEKGFIIGSDQQVKSSGYTGTGLFYANNRCWYVGSFVNGQPDGTGLFYLDARHREIEVEYAAHMLYGEFHEGAIASAEYWRNDFRERIETPAYAAERMKRTEQAAGAGDISAMWEMARQYYGSAKIKQPLKALEWLEKAAMAGDSTATIFVADAYAGHLSYVGSALDSFPKIPGKAAYWARIICKRYPGLETKQRAYNVPAYGEIFWKHSFPCLPYAIFMDNYLTVGRITEEDIDYYKWVCSEIEKESAQSKMNVKGVSCNVVQELYISDPATKFNIILFSRGPLSDDLEFAVVKTTQKTDSVARIRSVFTNTVGCRFETSKLSNKKMQHKLGCINGSLENVSSARDLYYFNLSPVKEPGKRVFTNWNRKGFDNRVINYSRDVIWAVFTSK